MAGGCDSVTKLLSPYVDDELSSGDRAAVQGHAQGCTDCQKRLVDLKATQAAMTAYLQQKAEGVDFSGFTARVMGQIKKEPLPAAQRLRLWWAELMAYHSAALYSAFGAAATAAVAVALVLGSPRELVNNELVVHSLSVQDPQYEPVVMHTDDGETVIMLVEHQITDEEKAEAAHPSESSTDDGKVSPGEVGQQPHGGNL